MEKPLDKTNSAMSRLYSLIGRKSQVNQNTKLKMTSTNIWIGRMGNCFQKPSHEDTSDRKKHERAAMDIATNPQGNRFPAQKGREYF